MPLVILQYLNSLQIKGDLQKKKKTRVAQKQEVYRRAVCQLFEERYEPRVGEVLTN
jgi:hypothetical protein